MIKCNSMLANAVYVLASISLVVAVTLAWTSFLSPYWLCNVTKPWPGRRTQSTELNSSYIIAEAGVLPSSVDNRGLWAQCDAECQWFYQHNYLLQRHKFTPLGWHLAAQVIQTIGVVLLLVCEIYVRVQLCCGEKQFAAYKALSAVLSVSLSCQVATVCIFGGFASRDYGVNGLFDYRYAYLGWSYWLALVACVASFFATLLFTVIGATAEGTREHQTPEPK